MEFYSCAHVATVGVKGLSKDFVQAAYFHVWLRLSYQAIDSTLIHHDMTIIW